MGGLLHNPLGLIGCQKEGFFGRRSLGNHSPLRCFQEQCWPLGQRGLYTLELLGCTESGFLSLLPSKQPRAGGHRISVLF